MDKIKSRPIGRGAKIGIVAPGSPVHSEAELEASQINLRQQGYQIILGQTVIPRTGYLAGDDVYRGQDLEKMWQDKTIAAIWCLRGGYGCLRLLNRLNYHNFGKNSKVFIGFSDITALELALWVQVKLVTFHGPVLTQFQSEFSQRAAWKMISGELKPGDLIEPFPGDRPISLRGGMAEGILLGGNLATISSLIGTRYFPEFKDAILFIEEAGEAVYRIDRMLTQLELTGIFDGIRGVMIGRCIPVNGETEMDLLRVFEEKLRNLRCPVGYGFPIGHLPDQWTVPQGVKVGVNMDRGEVFMMESALNID